MDAASAFPNLWQDGADYIAWKNGLRGKMWRILRRLEKGSYGFVRLNGHFEKLGYFQRGGAQGGTSMPHRWKWLISEFLQQVDNHCPSLPITGFPFPGVGYVDDINLVSWSDDQSKELMAFRSIFSNRWGYEWAPAKDWSLQRGPGRPKSVILDGKHCELSVLSLGEMISSSPFRCATQVSHTLKALRAASASLDWLLWRTGTPTITVYSRLFDSVVKSVAISHLILTDVNEAEWAKLESVKASAAKRLLGVTNSASTHCTYAELGWTSLRIDVQKARLGFVARLFRGAGGPMAQHILALRLLQLDDAPEDRTSQGLLGRERSAMEEAGLGHIWNQRPFPSKHQWKKIVNDAYFDVQKQQWKNWCKTGHLLGGDRWARDYKMAWGTENYLFSKDKTLVRMMTRFRLRVADIGAPNGRPGGRPCRFCDSPIETEVHIITSCTFFTPQRKLALSAQNFPERQHPKVIWRLLLQWNDSSKTFLSSIRKSFMEAGGPDLGAPLPGQLGPPPGSDVTFLKSLAEVAKWASERFHTRQSPNT
jgi:hypothetical protein